MPLRKGPPTEGKGRPYPYRIRTPVCSCPGRGGQRPAEYAHRRPNSAENKRNPIQAALRNPPLDPYRRSRLRIAAISGRAPSVPSQCRRHARTPRIFNLTGSVNPHDASRSTCKALNSAKMGNPRPPIGALIAGARGFALPLTLSPSFPVRLFVLCPESQMRFFPLVFPAFFCIVLRGILLYMYLWEVEFGVNVIGPCTRFSRSFAPVARLLPGTPPC